MKSKIASFIISFVMILIIGVLTLFGFLLYQEIIKQADEPIVEDFIGRYDVEKEDTVDTKTIETPKVIESNPFKEIGNSKNPNIVDYSNVNVDKYFYNQLEEPSKTIYKALESNKENMKSGTYKIELGENFSDILEKENGQEELGNYYQSAIEAYIYDNPEVFYLNPSKMYLNIETITEFASVSYNVFINSGNEANYLADGFTNEEEVRDAINKVEEVKNYIFSQRRENDYENIKMLHDYLVDNIEYDTTISRNNIYDVYGALVNRVSVCEGYARSFKYILDEMGIPCVLVIGTGTNSQGETERHAWNYVELEGSWYAVDCTWDDPIIIGGGGQTLESRYRYFLKGANEFNSDHIASGYFTPDGKEFSYPALSRNSY